MRSASSDNACRPRSCGGRGVSAPIRSDITQSEVGATRQHLTVRPRVGGTRRCHRRRWIPRFRRSKLGVAHFLERPLLHAQHEGVVIVESESAIETGFRLLRGLQFTDQKKALERRFSRAFLDFLELPGFPWTVGWWRGGGSNSRPSHCERDALPAELPPHCTGSLAKQNAGPSRIRADRRSKSRALKEAYCFASPKAIRFEGSSAGAPCPGAQHRRQRWPH